MYKYIYFTGQHNFRDAVIYTITFPSVRLLKKSLFQETTQYLDFFMLSTDVISVTVMTSSSKFKKCLERVNLNLGYNPRTRFGDVK